MPKKKATKRVMKKMTRYRAPQSTCGPDCNEYNPIHQQPDSLWYCEDPRCPQRRVRFPHSDVKILATPRGPANVCPFCNSEDIFADCARELEAAEAESSQNKAHHRAMQNSGYYEE